MNCMSVATSAQAKWFDAVRLSVSVLTNPSGEILASFAAGGAAMDPHPLATLRDGVTRCAAHQG
jgi:hypothetical protein